ncbi:transcriptional protein SWT1 [Synchiropus splendidus]|uniref:transcriptional protein SWT1 n=1 Tax=Synchiropus splendidus TaxID=270530 RepID=UPI00237E4C1A|nr:transcriptional protein SWT1 [Synchiropus splendidus]
MSKKSKKSKKRSYSSPSREDDEKKRKKSKENEDRRKSEDKYEDKNKHDSRSKHAVRHSPVHDKDSSRGRAIKKAVYRQSKTHLTNEESHGKHEGHSKSRTESQSCHSTPCSKDKPLNVGESTIVRDRISTDERPSTSVTALAIPVRHFLEKGQKTPEKPHTSDLALHPSRKDRKWIVVENSHRDPPYTRSLSSSMKARDSLRSYSVVEDSRRHASAQSFSTEPRHKDKHKAAKSTHGLDKTFTHKSRQSSPPLCRKSSEDHKSSRSTVMSRSTGTASTKEKDLVSKETKKGLCAKEKSPAENIISQSVKTSVSSARASKNVAIHTWSSVSSAPKIVKDIPHRKERVNLSCSQQKVYTLKSPEENVQPQTPRTSLSTNKASSTSKPWPVCAVPPKMHAKQSGADLPSVSCKTNSTCQASLDESCGPSSQLWCNQMQVAEQLHLARSEKRLEVNIRESYGELTCMDIDSPEEGVTATQSNEPQQDLILVLDTNILLSHLDYVKQVVSRGLEGVGHPVVLIPWVVLQELDSLKKGRGLAGSVSHLACPAISYIHNCLKNREPHLWGQSMQQASVINDGLNAENNDDRVLQCCLQYQTLYPGCALRLCTNDKNLCSKALLSGVKASSKTDLEAESSVSRRQSTHIPLLPVASSPSTTATPQQSKRPAVDKHEEVEKNIRNKCISELELCLKDVLADVLEKEMKAVYDDLWLEIVCRKPPWTLSDILQCFKKHWIAVFGSLVPRKLQDNVDDLIKFFNSGNSLPTCSVVASIRRAKEFVKAFTSRSSLVSNALSEMDNMVNTLQHGAAQLLQTPTVDESADCDVIMKEVEDYRQPALPQVSCQEVWAMFHNIWVNVFQISLEVFKALSFDPDSMQSGLPVGGPPPPQDALACLNKLSSMISQLLEAFSRVLSSGPGEDEVQNLLLVIRSNGISEEVSRVSEKDLLDCFSQQEYREKLLIGGQQLFKVKETLEACRMATSPT